MLGRVLGLCFRIALWLLLALAATILLYRFVPVPSTLMLGRWLALKPVERDWVPLDQISPHLIKAVIASEDQRFCSHRGVDWVELNKVLENEDGPSRGASTLTMQTAKNVFLWPGRSYIRKGLEIPLAMAIDLAWGKPRVMEVYLNVAEWGEGLFGAEAAAQRYFRKPASRLTPAEAARLAGALPNPLLRNPAKPIGGCNPPPAAACASSGNLDRSGIAPCPADRQDIGRSAPCRRRNPNSALAILAPTVYGQRLTRLIRRRGGCLALGQRPGGGTMESTMAVPKRKTSPSKRGMRRSADALKQPTYIEDKNSGELRRPHHVDLKSGMYRGRQVLKVKTDA